MNKAILLVSCPDQKGLVARLSTFIYEHGGNILHADHHIDSPSGRFLVRIEWDLKEFDLASQEIAVELAPLAESIRASWELHIPGPLPRISIWVTRQDHCLLDLLWRQRSGDLRAEVALIVSNHRELEPVARQFNIDFHYFPLTQENKLQQEKVQLEFLRQNRIDLVVLAKYMQILSPSLVAQLPHQIINIHHSFLPAFPGANPYHHAYERGVKIIGATAHYVTAALDEGPIIEQDITRISHRDTVADLVRKGKDLERVVLARAVRYHLERRVLVYNNKTVVFA